MDEDKYYYEDFNEDMDGEGDGFGAGFQDNDFIPLDDLVYAPLHALAKSSQQLRAYVVDAIKGMGIPRQNGQEETIQLNNINIAYDQVWQEGDEGYRVDNMQVQVPLLSIVPISSLNIEKARIDFCTEVRVEKGAENGCAIEARICAPQSRESDNLPKVSYQLKISSLPATEGIMRLADVLNGSHIVKKTDATPVATDGNLGDGEQKSVWQDVAKLKGKIKKLQRLYQKIEDMIAEQERLCEISRETYPDAAGDFNKDRYLAAQAQIAAQIMECREQIMDKEIEYGLERENEQS